jgi:hypothetical protein
MDADKNGVYDAADFELNGDLNLDHFVTKKEWLAAGKPEAKFDEYDQNVAKHYGGGTGYLSMSEMVAAMAQDTFHGGLAKAESASSHHDGPWLFAAAVIIAAAIALKGGPRRNPNHPQASTTAVHEMA